MKKPVPANVILTPSKRMPPRPYKQSDLRLHEGMNTPHAAKKGAPNLLEVLSQFTHLKWLIYGYFVAPCPFHNKGGTGLGSYIEMQPSTLMVFSQSGTYHCTVCYNVQGLSGGSGNTRKAVEWAARRIVKTNKISV